MIVDRILKIIELKGINKSKFYKQTGLSNGFLDKVKDIGASKIEDILNSFPDVNPIWLLTGKGETLIGLYGNDILNEPQSSYKKTICISEHEQVVKLLEQEQQRLKDAYKENGILEYRLSSISNELVKAQKEIERLKNNGNDLVKGSVVS